MRARTLAGLAAVLATVLVTERAVRVAPWVARPDDARVAATWMHVEQRAGPSPTCKPVEKGVETARLVLAADAGEDRAREVLATSTRLRRQGPLLDFVIGLRLFEQVLGWAERNERGKALVREGALDLDELRGALAREAVCLDRMLDDLPAVAAGEGSTPQGAPWPAALLLRRDRERAMLRLRWGEKVGRCAGAVAAATFHACVTTPPIESVPSVLVQALEPVVPEVTGLLARQERLLSGT